MMRVAWLFVALCCLTGCAGVRLMVSNATSDAVHSVRLEAEQGVLYEVDRIEAHAGGDYVDLEDRLPSITRLSWRDAKDRPKVQIMKQKKRLPAGFRGRLIYEIKEDGSAKLFLLPHGKEGGSLIPWNFDEGFDGTVSIPGLSNQQ